MLAWLREDDGDRLLAALNFAGEPRALGIADGLGGDASVVLSTDPDRAEGDVDARRMDPRAQRGGALPSGLKRDDCCRAVGVQVVAGLAVATPATIGSWISRNG